MTEDLGACPTGQHTTDFRQCGFMGCVDLRVWAKANRYRYRLEESYEAENSAHVKGDGRWFVEVLCKQGMIYPMGGEKLLAHVKVGAVRRIAEMPGVTVRRWDGRDREFLFAVDRLDEVAAVLKPKRLPGRATPTGEQLRVLQIHAFRGGKNTES